jgi:hypothetical protein
VGGTDTLWWRPDKKTRAEALWFSDGGITSNFPVHLFDALLPNWPTFGLNLGSFPDGHPHQDVWLPQDWQATKAPTSEVASAATSFVSAIVDTARSWRDTMQTGMPGYRGRVAWVVNAPAAPTDQAQDDGTVIIRGGPKPHPRLGQIPPM